MSENNSNNQSNQTPEPNQGEGLTPEQATPETSASQEFLDRARRIGRAALSGAGVALTRAGDAMVIGIEKTGEALTRAGDAAVLGSAKAGVFLAGVSIGRAEKARERDINKHYDAISSQFRINEIRDAAIRTVDKSAPIPIRQKTSTELAKGDLVSKFKDWRMERKLDEHSSASIDNKRKRNNTARNEARGKTFVSKVRNKASAGIDFLKGDASAIEMSNRVAEAKISTVYTEKGRVKRSGRAEKSEAKKVRKYATKIEKRAEKRLTRATKKVIKNEELLAKRQETLKKRKQRLVEIKKR